jgi:hypothetical protein
VRTWPSVGVAEKHNVALEKKRDPLKSTSLCLHAGGRWCVGSFVCSRG